MHNCPLWLPRKFFKQIVTLFRDPFWKDKHPWIRLEILQLPKDGGLAVPNAILYYLASQLQQLYGWNVIDCEDPIQQIIFSKLPIEPLVQLIVAHHFHNKCSWPTFNLIHNIWTTIQKDTQYERYTQYMPIWNNLK